MKQYILAFIIFLVINTGIFAAQTTAKDTRAFIKLNLKNRKQMITLLCADIYEKQQPSGITLPPNSKCNELMDPVIIKTINDYAKTLPSTINQSFAIAFGETIATQSRLRYAEKYSLVSRNVFIDRIKASYSPENLCHKMIKKDNARFKKCIIDVSNTHESCINSYISHMPLKLDFKDRRVFSKMIRNCNQQNYSQLIS